MVPEVELTSPEQELQLSGELAETEANAFDLGLGLPMPVAAAEPEQTWVAYWQLPRGVVGRKPEATPPGPRHMNRIGGASQGGEGAKRPEAERATDSCANSAWLFLRGRPWCCGPSMPATAIEGERQLGYHRWACSRQVNRLRLK